MEVRPAPRAKIAIRSMEAGSRRRLAPGARGFTLTEMLAVLMIVAVLGALAAPSFATLIRGQRVRTAASDLASALVFARSEAVKRNTDVTVSNIGASWNEGWQVTYDDGGTKTARSQPAVAGLAVTASAGSVTFGGGGRASTTALFTVNSNPASVDARCVEVRPDGLPRTWVDRTGDKQDCSDD
jgi:type IV fimbrial biogenesis protein FimT